MKKYNLLLIAFLFLFANSSNAQILLFAPNDTISKDTVVYNSADIVEQVMNTTNTTAVTQNFSWRRIAYDVPKGWNSQFCDPNHCWAGLDLIKKQDFIMTSNQEGLFKLDLFPNCTPGSGQVQFLVWSKADSANNNYLLTFNQTFTASPSCVAATSISEIQIEKIKFFPNPVREELSISGIGQIQDGRIEIYNLIGKKIAVKVLSGDKNEVELNLENLDRGLYFAKIYTGNTPVLTKTFSKID